MLKILYTGIFYNDTKAWIDLYPSVSVLSQRNLGKRIIQLDVYDELPYM